MAKVRISVISTVRNDKAAVGPMIDSLLSQSRKPDEIVICDGGSTDGTAGFIRGKYGRKVKVVVRPGTNIGMGRNEAIRASRFPYIAVIDGGCVADRGWLAGIAGHFPEAQSVAGVFLPVARNEFERVQADVACKGLDELKEDTFLPSSRSVAFRKSVWEAVGGYPENTSKGRVGNSEDTPFDLNVRAAGLGFALERRAIVYWRVRPNLRKFSAQFYSYGFGDGRTGSVWRLPLNRAVFCVFLASCASLAAFLAGGAGALLLGTAVPSSLLLALPAILVGVFSAEGLRIWQRKSKRNIPLHVLLNLVRRLSYLAGVAAGSLNRVDYPSPDRLLAGGRKKGIGES